ncbi:MAG: AAA family ATPase [Chloroflexota bacterium]
MRITSLSLHNFGKHGAAEWSLDPGMTVVRGPNESGKSTLQRALELVLTRPATSTAPDLEALRKWGAAPDAAPAVAISFTWDEEDGSVHQGRLAKVFAGAGGTTRLELDGQAVTDTASAEEMIASLSGVPTEGFLRSTASVRQTELAGLQQGEAALRDRLTASMSGADTPAPRALAAGSREPPSRTSRRATADRGGSARAPRRSRTRSVASPWARRGSAARAGSRGPHDGEGAAR